MSLLVGIVLGVALVGSTTARVLAVHAGRPAVTLVYSGVTSVAHYSMVAFVVSGDLAGYVGFSIGAAAVTAVMAHRRASTPLGRSRSGADTP